MSLFHFVQGNEAPLFFSTLAQEMQDRVLSFVADANHHYGGCGSDFMKDVETKFGMKTEHTEILLNWVKLNQTETKPFLSSFFYRLSDIFTANH